MSSFLGTYNISLDEKGRFNVPTKFRATLEQSGPQLVLCAMQPFLVVFPQKEWAENGTADCEQWAGRQMRCHARRGQGGKR